MDAKLETPIYITLRKMNGLPENPSCRRKYPLPSCVSYGTAAFQPLLLSLAPASTTHLHNRISNEIKD